MKFTVWKALARGVLLESLRRKDLWVVAILGVLIVLSAGALGFFGIGGLEVFAKDLAFSVLSLFATVLSVLTTCRLLPEEIKNRTLYPLLARPISRFDLLMGKLMGAVVTSWIGFLLLCSLTFVALLTFGVRPEAIHLQYILLKMMGIVVLCSVSLTLSTYMTPSAAATMSFVLAFGSTLIVRALLMAYSSSGDSMKWAFQAINGLVPQYSLFDVGGRAAYSGWALVPLWAVGALAAYMLVYSGGMIGLSWAKFRKQAV